MAAIKEASKKTKPEAPCSAGHAKVYFCHNFHHHHHLLLLYSVSEMGFVLFVSLEEGEIRGKNHSITAIGFTLWKGRKNNRTSNFDSSNYFENLI